MIPILLNPESVLLPVGVTAMQREKNSLIVNAAISDFLTRKGFSVMRNNFSLRATHEKGLALDYYYVEHEKHAVRSVRFFISSQECTRDEFFSILEQE